MQEAANVSRFKWGRGHPDLWRMEVEPQGLTAPALVYEEGWPFSWDNLYYPLEDAPDMFQEFARLGKQAYQIAQRKAAEIDRLVTTSSNVPPLDPILCLDLDETVRGKVLSFVQEYGPLRGFEPLAQPQRLPVADSLREAYNLYQAIEEVVAESNENKWRLEMLINYRMGGTRLIVFQDEESGELKPGHSCTDLLSAMWLQLYNAMSGGVTGWRPCNGCGLLFGYKDPRREYHDTACRNRAHSKRVYAKKPKKKGAQHER